MICEVGNILIFFRSFNDPTLKEKWLNGMVRSAIFQVYKLTFNDQFTSNFPINTRASLVSLIM